MKRKEISSDEASVNKKAKVDDKVTESSEIPSLMEMVTDIDGWTKKLKDKSDIKLSFMLEDARKKKFAISKLDYIFEYHVKEQFPDKKFNPEFAEFVTYSTARYSGDGVNIYRHWAEKCYLGDRDTFYDTRIIVDDKIIYDKTNE